MSTNTYKDIYTYKDMSLIFEKKSLQDALIEFEPLMLSIVNDIYIKLDCHCAKEDLLKYAKIELLDVYECYNCNTNGSFNHFAKRRLFSSLYLKSLKQLELANEINY